MPRTLDMPPGGRHDEGSTQYQEWKASQGREGNYQKSGGSSGGGGGSNRCFPASALVLTPQGWKEMGKVEVGSIVISYDYVSGKAYPREVMKKLEHPHTTIWEVKLSLQSKPILTTSHHRFLTQRGWVQTRQLKSGDEILTVTERFVQSSDRVISVENRSTQEPVFNLHTSIEHTYIVSGCVVHNFAYFLKLRTWWHRNFKDAKEGVRISWGYHVAVQ